ncbi:MAG: Dabb family protein [Cyclobacteriaceae bacterium]
MTKRRAFFKKSALATVSLGLFGTWANASAKNKMIKGDFIHSVYFWLKPETDISAFISGTQDFLNQVPEVIQYHLGTPAGTPRDVVDNSYSVSLIVTFASKEDQDIYQKHPAHLDYVDKNKDKWTDVKIFDSLLSN